MELTDKQWKAFDNFLTSVEELKYASVSATLLEVAKAYREDSKAARQEVDRLREENERLEHVRQQLITMAYERQARSFECYEEIKKLKSQLDYALKKHELIKEYVEITEEELDTCGDTYRSRLALEYIGEAAQRAIKRIKGGE